MSPRCQEASVHAALSFWRRWSPLPGLSQSVLKLPSDVPAGHLLGALVLGWGGPSSHVLLEGKRGEGVSMESTHSHFGGRDWSSQGPAQ